MYDFMGNLWWLQSKKSKTRLFVFSVEVFQFKKTKTPIGFGFLVTFWSVG